MPPLGVANNPGGVNGLYDEGELPYGAVKRLSQQTSAFPAPGITATPGLGAARQARRGSQRQPQPQRQTAAMVAPAPVPSAPPQQTPDQQAQATFQAVSQDPDANGYVHFFASGGAG